MVFEAKEESAYVFRDKKWTKPPCWVGVT